MANIRYYFSSQSKLARVLNVWDIIALFLILAIIVILGWSARGMAVPYAVGQPLPISLDPSNLPGYAARTVSRMAIALVFSLLFTFTFGTWAAKSKRAEKFIIPIIDILQSVPVLSFLSISIVGFIALFPGSLLGPECASIFAIFTSQAWNMALGFYQTLKTVPHDLREASDMFQLSAWQRFWRIEVPFSLSGLLWNTMMSISASWFFVVVSEAIFVSGQEIKLPGIGSYIWLAIEHMDMRAVGYAIAAMLLVIFLYDQLLFRPLIKWSEKFTFEQVPGEKASKSWVMNLLRRTLLLRYGNRLFALFADWFINLNFLRRHSKRGLLRKAIQPSFGLPPWFWPTILLALILGATAILIYFIINSVATKEIWFVFWLGMATASRVIVLIIISSIIWIPIGVWVGMRPKVAQAVQPIAQFLAAFPAYLLFPIVVLGIVHFNLNVEIWTSPLMILGSQWYILFNVIAGASSMPKELYQAVDNFGVKGWQWWRRLALPGIFPYYITGAITAAGGAWNASIVAEWVSWGDTTLKATGLGAYIKEYTATGDFARIALGTGMMCLFVLIFNRVIWQPLYRFAEERFR